MNLYKECKINRCITVNSLYTAFEVCFDDTYSFDGEAHDFWELVYVKKGRVGIVADDNIYTLSSGQLAIHRPMEFHRIWSEDNENPIVIIISFGAEWNPVLLNNIFEADSDEGRRLFEILSEIKSTFIMENRSVSACRHGMESRAQKIINDFENFLLTVVDGNGAKTEKTIEPTNRKYADIIKILSENIDKDLSLADVAERCNMSVSNLKKIFYKYSGMGIKHYFNEMKARQAVQYMKDGFNVKETAAKLGFADQNYFSMFFKRLMGKSPTNYMK